MPRLPDDLLEIIIYLYPTVEDAKNGEAFGGTGFLLGLPSRTTPPFTHIYAVTNSHVVHEDKGNATVIRLNTRKGNTDFLETDVNSWLHHPDGDDVAICYLGTIAHHVYKFKVLFGESRFLTKNLIDIHNIGIGDEVFMAGKAQALLI